MKQTFSMTLLLLSTLNVFCQDPGSVFEFLEPQPGSPRTQSQSRCLLWAEWPQWYGHRGNLRSSGMSFEDDLSTYQEVVLENDSKASAYSHINEAYFKEGLDTRAHINIVLESFFLTSFFSSAATATFDRTFRVRNVVVVRPEYKGENTRQNRGIPAYYAVRFSVNGVVIWGDIFEFPISYKTPVELTKFDLKGPDILLIPGNMYRLEWLLSAEGMISSQTSRFFQGRFYAYTKLMPRISHLLTPTISRAQP